MGRARAAMVFTLPALREMREVLALNALDFANNRTDHGCGRRVVWSGVRVFLDVNFRCYITHSISGSKIIVNFPVVYNGVFFALSGVAHRCASWRA
jgi:hypothetical protein